MNINNNFDPHYLLFRFDTNERLDNFRKNGYMYLKNIDFFIKLEKLTNTKGKGDYNEARACVIENLKIYDKNDNFIGSAIGPATLRTSNIKHPIYCMTVKNIFENIIEFNYPNFKSLIQFDKKMLDDFCKDNDDPHVLCIHNTYEFLNRVKFTLEEMNLTCIWKRVQYKDTSIANEVDNYINFNGPFDKDEYFSYQSEFRILVETPVDDFLDFSIGSIEDISTLISVNDILNGLQVAGNVTQLD